MGVCAAQQKQKPLKDETKRLLFFNDRSSIQ